MMYHRSTRERGFVALMSVVLVSAVLLVLVFTLYISSFFSRFDALDGENKRTSLGLAEACVSVMTLKIAQNASYTPVAAGDCVSLGGVCGATDPQKVCKICAVSYFGNTATGDIRALYNGAYTNVRVDIDMASGTSSVTKWQELPVGSATCTVP